MPWRIGCGLTGRDAHRTLTGLVQMLAMQCMCPGLAMGIRRLPPPEGSRGAADGRPDGATSVHALPDEESPARDKATLARWCVGLWKAMRSGDGHGLGAALSSGGEVMPGP